MAAAKALRALVPPVVLATCSGFTVALMIILSGAPADGRLAGVLVSSEQGVQIAESAGLSPGATESRMLRLANPHGTDITITALTAVVGHPVDRDDQPVVGCLPVVAEISLIGAPVRVPSNGAREVAVTVRLANTVQRACKDVRFPLIYSGVAS